MARLAAPELGPVRTLTGFVLALALPPLLEWGIFFAGSDFLAVDVLLQVAGVVAVALVGGLWPALLCALWSSLILNYYSTEPFGSLEITNAEDLLTLLIFVAVAVSVSLVVGLAARRSREAAIASADAATLGELARGVLAAEDTLQSFLHHVRTHFGMAGAALYARGDEDDGRSSAEAGTWKVLTVSGRQVTLPDLGDPAGSEAAGVGDASTLVPGGLKLVLYGHALTAREQRLLVAFGSQLAALRQRQQLLTSTEKNRHLAEGNVMRTAILRAVSHDLRTPLAAIKLAVTSLRQQGIDFSPDEEAELLGTIEDSSDRLASLIDNLLDMSRLSGDTATPHLGPVHWPDVVAAALQGMPSENVRILLPPNPPPVQADFGMLERVIANIAENAQKHAGGSDIVVTAAVSGTVGDFPAGELRLRDHGRGVDKDGIERIFQPFQRLDDAGTAGLGLGLAVARGFTEVMGGELRAEPAPGGGLTMIIRLPLSTGVRQ
ncbi:ATP-binding protein [Arthrobacter sp. Br18]|uniref:sensor histidine kinase n=1 Tax=Arthrobacter sp. Br18 TaxID=1312954 RepID=UPI00138AC670|nr:ATP-binding protein [Arthrobacter sp. Br18]